MFIYSHKGNAKLPGNMNSYTSCTYIHAQYAKKISEKHSQEINSRSGNVDQEGNFPYTLLHLNSLTMSMNSYIRFFVWVLVFFCFCVFCFCFLIFPVHRGIPSTWSSAWHIVGAQKILLDKWTHDNFMKSIYFFPNEGVWRQSAPNTEMNTANKFLIYQSQYRLGFIMCCQIRASDTCVCPF